MTSAKRGIHFVNIQKQNLTCIWLVLNLGSAVRDRQTDRSVIHVGLIFICGLKECFATDGPRAGTGPWHKLYRAARGSPGICHFSFLSNFHE